MLYDDYFYLFSFLSQLCWHYSCGKDFIKFYLFFMCRYFLSPFNNCDKTPFEGYHEKSQASGNWREGTRNGELAEATHAHYLYKSMSTNTIKEHIANPKKVQMVGLCCNPFFLF